MSNAPFLSIKNANIGYQQPLIEQVNAQIHQGEVVLMIGANGIGKTTLLKSLLKQIPFLNGQVYLNQNNLNKLDIKTLSKNIAVVWSKYQLPQHYTVRDLVALGKYVHYPYYFSLKPADEAEVMRIIQNLGLEMYVQQKLNTLSDGNLQKAFIGRALAQNTPMIILDEPTTYLDENNKISILKLLRNLAQKHHKTILFSSHDWRLAKEFSDQIWLIKEKKLYAGVVEDVLKAHAELTHFPTFHFSETFKAPNITAPDEERSLLLSLLRKNTAQDWSAYQFHYQNHHWQLHSSDGNWRNFKNFQEIKTFFNHLQK
ncbi:ABC transporter ATP-binding protein [Riemerella columbina]|uniref:ABC transporter ATP-binding protein n=1 Tax=Riemerella columbina TaxID=103810 RepID=UPI00266EE98C|nr:ABC transporter ATP-binding protein [Riemerella columbina]WKS94392.1 ABC transporter ATP-binding protein [Riemerella columbina]